MPGKQKTEFLYWLIPTEPHFSSLSQIIIELANRYDAPAFAPHITIYSGEPSQKTMKRVFQTFRTRGRPIRLTPISILQSHMLTKTLYLQFELTGQASEMAEKIESMQEKESGFVFDPHLSLIYQKVPEKIRKKFANQISVQFEPISFNELRVIETKVPVDNTDTIRHWSNADSMMLS